MENKKTYQLEISSSVSVTVQADDEEDARIVAMENSENGEKLLENAYISDACEVQDE